MATENFLIEANRRSSAVFTTMEALGGLINMRKTLIAHQRIRSVLRTGKKNAVAMEIPATTKQITVPAIEKSNTKGRALIAMAKATINSRSEVLFIINVV